jgi:hypothetical protein
VDRKNALEELMRERIRGTIEATRRGGTGGSAGRRALAAGRRQSHRLSAWQTPADPEQQPRRDHDYYAARSDR